MMKTKTTSGYTVIELMLVVAVVSVLAAIGFPSYQESVRKSARKMGNATLIEVAGRQEQYFVNNKQYASDLTNLGYPANGFYIDKKGQTYSAAGNGTVYLLEIAASSATTYTLQAVPQSGQSSDSCGTLSYTNAGLRSPTTDNCW